MASCRPYACALARPAASPRGYRKIRPGNITKLSVGDSKFTYQPGCSSAPANVRASSSACPSSAVNSSAVQMPGRSGVAPGTRYRLILRTVRFRSARLVPTRRLSASSVPSITAERYCPPPTIRGARCAGCGRSGRRLPGTGGRRLYSRLMPDADAAFAAFAQSTVDGLLERRPELATLLGEHAHDDRLTIGTAAHYDELARWC